MTTGPQEPVAGLRALDSNMAQTAVEVVVPDEHLVLLDIASDWVGVRRATEELLREVHHRYASWGDTLVDVHRRATGDLHHYNRHPRGAEALRVFCDIYAGIAGRAPDAAVRGDAVRLWLTYLERVVAQSGRRREDNLPVVGEALARMAPWIRRDDRLAAEASRRLRRLADVLMAEPTPAATAVLEDALALLADALRRVYAAWLRRPDPLGWYRDATAPARPEPPAELRRISHAALTSHLRELERLGPGAALEGSAARLLALPDDGEIIAEYLDAARSLAAEGEGADLLIRVHWLLHLLEEEALAGVHEAALREVNALCARLIGSGERSTQLVREVFALLRRPGFPHTRAVHELVGTIGAHAVGSGDPAVIDALVEEMLDFDFDLPGFSGFTSEWGVRVDPGHLRGIRMYMRMIEADPVLAQPLIAALVVHLRLGGIVVLDTDLFQRDVSSLLGRPIGPAYLLVKQLLRVFPVYFGEIGAEGELRRASTELDQMEERRDPLCHLLRKQSHVDCNPMLSDVADEIFRYWATGDARRLGDYVPPTVMEALAPGARWAAGPGPSSAAARLARASGGVDEVLALGCEEIDARLDRLDPPDEAGRRKVSLLFQVRREIRRKYALDHSDAVERLRRFGRLDRARVAALAEALEGGRGADALDALLSVLEALQEIVLTPGPVEAVEDIYRKRHIAAGIPSMYGSYREDRFEAMGLTFRLESLAGALMEQVIDDERLVEDLDRERMRAVARWLRLLHRSLRIDGFRARGIAHCLSLLDQAVDTDGVTIDQYVNIFQLTSRSIETLVRARILDVYEEPARRIVARMIERGALPGVGEDDRWAPLKVSETLMRDLIADSPGLQRLDALVGRVLRALVAARDAASWPVPRARAPVDVDGCLIPFGRGEVPEAGIMSLGNKGFMLSRLVQLGFRVPSGFVVTTELVRHADGLAGDDIPPDVVARLGEQVARLERVTGRRLGDPGRPLLLSVRGGAPVSMPGMLETFLDVGITDEVAEGMASIPRHAWAAWDCRRRFLQFWGMGHGIGRHHFDELLADAKRRYGVPRKRQLGAAQMREVAAAYRGLIGEHGVDLVDDPVSQLLSCIRLVRRSWHSEHARLYRRALHIAEEWETAVIVQEMVLGNLDGSSGTGVLLTSDPHRASAAREPYGDWVVQGQGDDVVAGLVETRPLTESQRRRRGEGAPESLQTAFPAVYRELAAVATALVDGHGLNPQEVEFTFESAEADGVYLLQTRDAVATAGVLLPAFEPSAGLEAARIASGIGVGGGALCGRVAHSAHDVATLRREHPDDPIILLRRDTIPDDIPLMLHVAGLLTSLGGATSHAAVTAKRVGKTCVVGCRPAQIAEREGESSIGGMAIRTGDLISIDGMDGSVYAGAHPIARDHVWARAQE